MSNYANIDYEINNKEITNIKNKFITTEDPSLKASGYYRDKTNISTKAAVIDYETNLLTPAIYSKDKTQLKLNDDFNPNNFDIIYNDSLRKDCVPLTSFYYTNKDGGAGRGFGNLDISNDIRNSDASRNNTKELKQQQESVQILDYQYQYLDRDIQNPANLIMPIPRGGEPTRKQNQLSVNSMRSNNDDYAKRIKTIKFDY